MFLCSAVHNMFGLNDKLMGINQDNTFEVTIQQARQEETARQIMDEDLVQAILPGSTKLHDHQKQVLRHLTDSTIRDIVYIAPTGAGKSVAFMLPALANNGGQFVLIEPTVALQQDMARRLEKAGISTYTWRPAMTDRAFEAKSGRVSHDFLIPSPSCFNWDRKIRNLNWDKRFIYFS